MRFLVASFTLLLTLATASSTARACDVRLRAIGSISRSLLGLDRKGVDTTPLYAPLGVEFRGQGRRTAFDVSAVVGVCSLRIGTSVSIGSLESVGVGASPLVARDASFSLSSVETGTITGLLGWDLRFGALRRTSIS